MECKGDESAWIMIHGGALGLVGVTIVVLAILIAALVLGRK